MGLPVGPPSPSPPQPGREQRVLWSQTSRCWAQVWDRAPDRDGSSRSEGKHRHGHPPPAPAVTLHWRWLHWDRELSNGVGSWGQERSCGKVLPEGTGRAPAFPRRMQELPGLHTLLLWAGEPQAWSHHCWGAQDSPVPQCPAGLGSDAAPGVGAVPARDVPGNLAGDQNNPVLYVPSSRHLAGGPAGRCHQWLLGEQRAVGC